MKKQIVLSGLAAACMLAAYASSEKIALMRNGEKIGSIRVERLSEITYSGDANSLTTINFKKSDGTVESYQLTRFDRMVYTAPLPENPVTIEVTPHHTSATLNVTAPEGVYYRISGMPVKSLAGIDEDDWADYIVDNDRAYVRGVADFYGKPLSDYTIDEICQTGSMVRDWFPNETIIDNTPIALVVYTAQLDGDDLAVTTEPRLIRFTTKELVAENITFDISADLTSTTATIKADGTPADIPFAIELYTKTEIEVYGLKYLMNQSVVQYTRMVYNRGMDWSDFTFLGHGERTWTNTAVGEEYVAVAFGCEYGVITTEPTTKDYVIPEPVITDNCTFEVETTQLSPGEMSVKVTPSDNTTRYAVFLVSGERLDATTASRYVGSRIKWYRNSGTIRWEEDEYVYTGERTVTTHDGVIGAEYLEAGKEYYILVCGITPDGVRTTDIRQVRCVTEASETDEVTFDIRFGDLRRTGSTAFQPVTVKSSDQSAKYVVESLPSTNYYADLSCSDEEFMQRYIEVQGQYLNLRTGDSEVTLSYQKEWDFDESCYAWGKQIVFVFGYDGVVTSRLYVFEVDTETGEARQVRGPGAE